VWIKHGTRARMKGNPARGEESSRNGIDRVASLSPGSCCLDF
jgi:hypothetical protein